MLRASQVNPPCPSWFVWFERLEFVAGFETAWVDRVCSVRQSIRPLLFLLGGSSGFFLFLFFLSLGFARAGVVVVDVLSFVGVYVADVGSSGVFCICALSSVPFPLGFRAAAPAAVAMYAGRMPPTLTGAPLRSIRVIKAALGGIGSEPGRSSTSPDEGSEDAPIYWKQV